MNPWKRFVEWWKSLPRLEDQPVPEEDPIISRSLSWPIAISSLLLTVTLLWAFYNEGWGLRPWVRYQNRFVELYRKHLQRIGPLRAEEERALHESEGYQKLQEQLKNAEAEIRNQLAAINAEEQMVRRQLDALTPVFTTERSRIQAVIYEIETASEEDRERLRKELEELRRGPFEVDLPVSASAAIKIEEKQFSFEEMEELFNELKAEQGRLQNRRIVLLRRPTEIRREMEAYLKARLDGLTTAQVHGLMAKMDQFRVEIKQIHNPEMNLVDRCESCHLGAREPVLVTTRDMEGMKVFTSHPKVELLTLHDPEVFGCSPCHNGNGAATVSTSKAHGNYKHWLWPLYKRENFEAGCLQCHEADRNLRMAPVLNAGKELFYNRGCWGCHAREGFDSETRELRDARKMVEDLAASRQNTEIVIERTVARADRAATNEEADRLYAQAESMTLSMAHMDTLSQRYRSRIDELLMEVKTQGPNLKEIRAKLRKEWIPVWVSNPHAFRPTTKMPRFRLQQDEIEAMTAFLWQNGINAPVPAQPPGNPSNGKQLFETRGCMACHAMGEGRDAVGGTFAANLSRVGEKVNYDYLVRWIHNPRERLYPYCPVHRRDITPQDYASKGLPFEFSLENNRCPLGDHSLQVQNRTVMPNLRLSWEEARDVASFLMTQRKADAFYPPAPFVDQQLLEKGRFLTRHYGCHGCHEIAGLEESDKNATDLTKEGSKPIERLDFALLTHEARKEDWYNHKGFFEHKLADPAVYDQGKIKQPLERLRMPNFNFNREQIDQLTTYLLGSVDSVIPEKFHYRPTGPPRDIQEGWWVVMKYNCDACHQFEPGQRTVLQDLPRYQDPDWRDQLPPSLIGEGARVNPEWLARFLKNPALSSTDLNRNGVRNYLQARMPTFNLSDGEVQKLVRFFEALSEQRSPYLPPPIPALDDGELALARQLFTHPAAPCLVCHATGDPERDKNSTAPNFLLVRERLKPDWTERWIVHPEIIRPGTAMPSGLFRWDGTRYVFALAELESFKGYTGDHAHLVVRYMFQLTPEEQRRLKAH